MKFWTRRLRDRRRKRITSSNLNRGKIDQSHLPRFCRQQVKIRFWSLCPIFQLVNYITLGPNRLHLTVFVKHRDSDVVRTIRGCGFHMHSYVILSDHHRSIYYPHLIHRSILCFIAITPSTEDGAGTHQGGIWDPAGRRTQAGSR